MKLNKYIITSIIFLIIITWVGAATFWNNREKFLSAVKNGNVINDVNEIYSKNVAYSDSFINLWSETQAVSKTQLLDDAEYGTILKDDTGNLYFPVKKVDISNQAQKVIDFSNYLKEKGTHFAYIQAPNKVLDGYTDKIVYDYNFSNQNADELLEKLNENGVNTLDLRELITSDELDKDKLFYKTDHHWTAPTAFWAYTKIINYLNEEFDLHIDSDDYYKNLDNYKTRLIEDCFLGSLGRRVGRAVSGLDDYTFIEPNFKTDYEIYNAVVSKEKVLSSGNFHKAIVKDYILNSDDVTTNKHGTYFEWDYGDLIIKNKLANNDIKILIIKDSFALPVVAFLSTCVSEVRMIDLRDTPKPNLADILDSEKFDAVLLMYNTEAVDIVSMFEFLQK